MAMIAYMFNDSVHQQLLSNITMPVHEVQLIRNVQIMNSDPFSSFPCFNKIHAYEWHIYKSRCQFRMRKLEVVATQDLHITPPSLWGQSEQHIFDRPVSGIGWTTVWFPTPSSYNDEQDFVLQLDLVQSGLIGQCPPIALMRHHWDAMLGWLVLTACPNAKWGENMLFSFPQHHLLVCQQAVEGAILHHHGW